MALPTSSGRLTLANGLPASPSLPRRNAASPAKTAAGREFIPVRASEDLSFDSAASPVVGAAADQPRRIRFYRNPMGLPDISKVPKKDSMGMAYIPVYENEAAEAGKVSVNPGRLQTLGVRTATVTCIGIATIAAAVGAGDACSFRSAVHADRRCRQP